MSGPEALVPCRVDRAAIIGDIHGRADLLEALLEKLGGREVFVVGDLCDRGPETLRVMALLVERGARGVLGNHDLWFREWANGRGFDRFALTAMMGGEATLASYGIDSTSAAVIEAARGRVPAEHARLLESLQTVLHLEIDGAPYVLVHAGVPSLPQVMALPEAERLPYLMANRPNDLLWRKTLPQAVPPVGATLVMGHVPLPVPVDLGHVIAIDTGCGTCAPDALTAVLLPERRFVTVDAPQPGGGFT